MMSAHLAAAAPNFRMLEIEADDVPWKDDLVTLPPVIENGELLLPAGPGWGCDVNEEAVRIFGWSRQEMVGEPFQMIVAKSRQDAADDGLQRCFGGEIVRDIECAGVTKAGRELPGSFALKLLTDDHGQPDAICLLAKYSAP